jgi:hypothetical protein
MVTANQPLRRFSASIVGILIIGSRISIRNGQLRPKGHPIKPSESLEGSHCAVSKHHGYSSLFRLKTSDAFAFMLI